jgi:Lysophospholipase L1 and related esterases
MKFSRRNVLSFAAVALIIALAALSVFMFFQWQSVDQVKVACVGDSITISSQYPLDLWASLGPGYIVGDFGVGGAAVAQSTGMGYLHLPAIEVAKQFQPDIVVIMLGTNDAYTYLTENSTEFISDYLTIIGEFESLAKKPVIYLVAPIPIYSNSVSLSDEILVQRVIPNIEQVAAQTGLQVIDAHTPLQNHPELYLDGIHPTADGAKVLADVIYAGIR